MKTKTILSIFFMITFFSVKAQFNMGLNGEFSIPTKDIGVIINFTTGGELFAAYTINNSIDFNIAYSYSYFNSGAIEFQSLSGLSSNIKYYITKKDKRLYLGFGAGKYNMKFEVMQGQGTQEFNGWGIKPTIGMIFKTNFLKNLYINSSLSYFKVFDEINLKMFSFNLGVVYYI